MAWQDVRDAVGHSLSDAVQGEGEMVTRWVAVFEVVDSDGKRAAYAIAPEQATAWDTLGLLDYAHGRERAAMVRDMLEGVGD